MPSSILLPSRCTQQPTQAPQIDWSNPITQGLAFAFVHGAAAMGFAASGQNYLPYVGATQQPTPLGTGARSTSTSTRAYSLSNHGLTTTNYSLFAVGTAASGVTQSAIDADNSSPRYFQFRITGNKVDFIPFNTSAAVTGQPVMATALTAAELARGFTMGATASPTRTAAFQNGQIATATPSSMIAPTLALPLSIGARATGATGWSTGALAMVAGWSRTLSDAEMLSLAANPWQIFKGPNRRLLIAAAGAGPVDTPVTPGAGALALTGYAPTVAQSVNQTAAPAAGALTLTGYVPSVTRTAHVSTTPGTGSLTLTGYAPTVTRTTSQTLQPSPGGLTLTGYAPLITQGADNAPRVNVATLMRITTTNRTANLGGVLNLAAPIRSTGPNVATIMRAGAVNSTADLGPATINRTVSFP